MIYKIQNLMLNISKKIVNFKKKVFFPLSVSVNKLTRFEGSNHIKKNTNLRNSSVGFGTYIGENCNLHGAKIGRFCSIANDVSVIISDHPINMVSTHPCFHKGNHPVMKKIGLTMNLDYNLLNSKRIKGYNIQIGSDVWIGESVKIMNDIVIGDGAIIGTGAIVTKDVPPYSICVGVPAKVIKYRFDSEVIDFFIKNQWWKKSTKELLYMQNLFLDVDKFIKYEKIIKKPNL